MAVKKASMNPFAQGLVTWGMAAAGLFFLAVLLLFLGAINRTPA